MIPVCPGLLLTLPYWESRDLGLGRRILLQLLEDERDGLLELRIVSGYDQGGCHFNLDVRINPHVFNDPFALGAQDPQARRRNIAAVHKIGIIVNAHQASPGSFPDKFPQPLLFEIIGKGISA